MDKTRRFITFNHGDHFQSGLLIGLKVEGNALVMRPDKSLFQGTFYSAAIDSGEDGFSWGRVTIKGDLGENVILRCSLYAADTRILNEDEPDIDAFIQNPYINSSVKASTLDRLYGTPFSNTRDFLAGCRGRYLFLRLEMIATGMNSPRVEEIRFQIQGDHMMDYLPGLYSREDPEGFTRRFLSIFDSTVLDMEEAIYRISQQLDYERSSGEMLRYLASWLCLEEEGEDDFLRQRIAGAMEEYRYAQTPRGISRAIQRWTGVEPILVEHFTVDKCIRAGKDQALYKKLFGQNPYRFFVLLPERALGTRARADAFLERLRRIIPAHVEAELVLLKEGVYLDWNTYMGVNSRVADYKTVSMDESAALDYNTVIADTEGGQS